MKKTALYVGFSKDPNFGDWWLYEVIKDQMPEFSLIPIGRMVKRYGVRRLIYRGWANRLLPSPHVTLLGGGTLLIPGTTDMVQPLTSTRGPKFTLGTGARSIEECERIGFNSKQRDTLAAVYSQFKEITVRGPISQASFANLGTGQTAEIVGDPMLSLFKSGTPMREWDGRSVLLNAANLKGTQKRYWEPSHGNEDALYDEIVTDCHRRGLQVSMFYVSPEDREISERVAARHNLATPVSALSPDELDRVFSGNAALIATRLHAMIYAFICGVRTATLPYADKHLDFLQSVGWTQGPRRLHEIHPGQVMDYVDELWEGHAAQWPEISQSILELNAARAALFQRIARA